jgi:sarcosine oxidase subunit alpha
MWPKSFWMRYEHYIRKGAGLGIAPEEADTDRYDRMTAHCDVLVVGGGPAGLAAALAAGNAGARVILADEQQEFGGSLLSQRDIAAVAADPASDGAIGGASPMAWVTRTVARLAAMPDVRLLPRSTVFGYHDHNFLTIAERLTDHLQPAERKGPRERIWRVRAREVVLATGAIERPLVFANNDRPGVMLASAVSAFVNRYGVQPGTRAVVFTNNDSAYRTALRLVSAGIDVAAVVDARRDPRGPLPERARKTGIEVIANAVVVDVRGTWRVSAVDVMALDANGTAVTGTVRTLPCDLVAMSGGWNPVVHLHAQSGGKAQYDGARACFIPGASVQAERSVGAANGSFMLGDCLAEGDAAGVAAASRAGFTPASASFPPTVADVVEDPTLPLWVVPSAKGIERGPKQFVDLQNDVAASDICSPRVRAISRSSTRSATPRWASAPSRESSATSTASRSSRMRSGKASRRPEPRRFGRTTHR